MVIELIAFPSMALKSEKALSMYTTISQTGPAANVRNRVVNGMTANRRRSERGAGLSDAPPHSAHQKLHIALGAGDRAFDYAFNVPAKSF